MDMTVITQLYCQFIHIMSTTCFGQYYFWPSSGWVQKNGTERSETSAYKIQTPEKYPEESIQHSEHGGSLKSGIKPRLYRTAVKKNIVPAYTQVVHIHTTCLTHVVTLRTTSYTQVVTLHTTCLKSGNYTYHLPYTSDKYTYHLPYTQVVTMYRLFYTQLVTLHTTCLTHKW